MTAGFFITFLKLLNNSLYSLDWISAVNSIIDGLYKLKKCMAICLMPYLLDPWVCTIITMRVSPSVR